MRFDLAPAPYDRDDDLDGTWTREQFEAMDARERGLGQGRTELHASCAGASYRPCRTYVGPAHYRPLPGEHGARRTAFYQQHPLPRLQTDRRDQSLEMSSAQDRVPSRRYETRLRWATEPSRSDCSSPQPWRREGRESDDAAGRVAVDWPPQSPIRL